MLTQKCDSKNIFQVINQYSKLIPRMEVELLLAYIHRCKRVELYIDNRNINEEGITILDTYIKRRLCGEPIQYITGTAEFMSSDFVVSKDVFIPRSETELLVEKALELANMSTLSGAVHARVDSMRKHANLDILDLCTGSGNIAISLALRLEHVNIVAADISELALKVARENAMIHGVSSRIDFLCTNLFDALMLDKNKKFDIIVCNPPYIPRHEFNSLQKEVRFEPGIALDGGEDGLRFYRKIEEHSPRYLKKGGSLLLEMGYNQVSSVKRIFNEGTFKIRRVWNDFAGIDRVIWIGLL